MSDPIQDLLDKYTYNSAAFKQVNENLKTYRAVQQDNVLPVTIKIIQNYQQDLLNYFQRLKAIKSDYVIKIIDIAYVTTKCVLIMEDISFGTLATAISKPKRLEDSDAVYVAKTMLYGRIDLMKLGINWFGDQNDIEFTESGMKLSWNGSSFPAQQYINPFPEIILRISKRETTQSLLPFPKNKQIQELISISNANASEMGAHTLLKKREKLFKKKGKSWLAIKQTRVKSQYFQQVTYLAVSPIHGFVKVRVFEKGKIQPQVLQLNRSRKQFTRLIDHYDDTIHTYLVSEYSNDGNLQQYINRLKASNMQLNQEQIEYIFFSLIQPLKNIQQSPLLSINTIHIRNIFIQNGIFKIGEPYTLTLKLQKIFDQRSEVPDFYYPAFKTTPTTHNPCYDTYSLGILLYKLMYQEYPIFPEKKVHIPATPAYNVRLTQTLELFLNESGKLIDIESRIQISENVRKKINQNIIKNKKIKVQEVIEEDFTLGVKREQQSINRIDQSDFINETKEHKPSFLYRLCCEPVTNDPAEKNLQSFWIDLDYSPYRNYRICTKILLVTFYYILLLYMFYLNKVFDLLLKSNQYYSLAVSINYTAYVITTDSANKFYLSFNSTAQTLTNLTSTLNCAVNTQSINYTNIVGQYSASWITFLVMSLFLMIAFILMKIWQTTTDDLGAAISNYHIKKHTFNISRYILFNLCFSLALFSHFFLFNFLFNAQTSPCFGGDQTVWYSSTNGLFSNSLNTIIGLSAGAFTIFFVSFLQLCLFEKIKYTKVVNPITIFGCLLVAFTLLMRVGLSPAFTPSWTQASMIINQIQNGSYITLFGMFPQVLVLGEIVLNLIIDEIFWRCLDRKKMMLVHDISMSELRQ